MTVILLDGGNWNKINVLTSNFMLLDDQLLDEIPYRHAIYFYKIQLLTNQKAPFQELASEWSKVGFYKGCPQQNKALYENFQYNS